MRSSLAVREGKGPDLDLICNVRVNRPEAKANALLIAAAPDLLAVSQAALTTIEACRNGSDCPDFVQWEADLRAAIARATGAS